MTQAIMNLDERVRESLRQKIITGELGGGYHLSELKISKEYNVSRTPVREALCALAADGLVEMIPHRGAFVANVPAQTRADQLMSYGFFMGVIARLTTEKASIEALMDIETGINFLSEAKEQNKEGFTMAVQGVVTQLRNAADSSTMAEALNMIERRCNMADVWQGAFAQRKDIIQNFGVLLNAIKRQKADTAEKTMRQIMVDVFGEMSADENSSLAGVMAESEKRSASSAGQSVN